MQNHPIRVLHIITRMIVGGAQENTLLSVEGLDQLSEFEVTLLSGVDNGPEGDLLSRARKNTNLLILPELGRNINPFYDLIAFWKLWRIIRSGHYHIVHTHSSKAGVLGRIAAKLAGTPIIVHTLHSLVFHEYQPWFVNRLWWLVKKICAPITDYFISVSSVISQKALASGIGYPEQYKTIYSGMELDWYLNAHVDTAAIRQEFGIPTDALVVGKVARLFPLKGHDQFLDAAPAIVAQHPTVRFFFIGDGILKEHLQERARALGILDNFIFAGLVERERIPAMIAAMDVLVHTSLREGLARVLPQALAMAKPCVSFNIDGAPEVVIPDQTGYLVAPEDTSGLAAAVNTLLADPVLRAQMGKAGRALVDPAFRAETMIAQIAAVYRHLIEKKQVELTKFNQHQSKGPTSRKQERCNAAPNS